MRDTQILQILRDFDYRALVTRHFSKDNRVISNIRELNERLNGLSKVPGFDGQIINITQNPIFLSLKDSADVPNPNYSELLDSISTLRVQLWGIENYLSSIVRDSKSDSVFIRIPDTNRISGAAADMGTIEKIFEQVLVNEQIGGRVELKSWEKGSFWLELAVGPTVGVWLIGSIYWASAVISKKKNEARMFEEKARSLKIQNESLLEIQKKQKEMMDLLIENEAKHIQNDDKISITDPEYTRRLIYCISEFSDLINKGAEMSPALGAPESVKNLFPAAPKIPAIESRIPKLTSSQES